MSYTVTPHTYIRTSPGVSGVNSSFRRVSELKILSPTPASWPLPRSHGHRCDGQRGNPLFATEEAQLLGALGLDAHATGLPPAPRPPPRARPRPITPRSSTRLDTPR